MRFNRRVAGGVVIAAALAAPTLALGMSSGSSPMICSAQDRAQCGGRVIPAPQRSPGFLTYPAFQSAMKTLARLYPSRVHVIKVGHSFGGYPLYDVLVSDFADHRPIAHRGSRRAFGP